MPLGFLSLPRYKLPCTSYLTNATTSSKLSFNNWLYACVAVQHRKMATVKDSIPHVVRTAGDQRQREQYNANIGRIEQINSRIRLFRLYLAPGTPTLRHLPGQYVDLHVPEIDVVGGFTITSPPQTALRLPAPTPSTTTPPEAATYDDPYIELAIQDSPTNPPAAFLWQPPEKIMNAPVSFRIGGNFTYPPLTLSKSEFEAVNNVVFIAGGVGINPIMSMISAMDLQGSGKLGGMPRRIRVLYTSRREAAKQNSGLSERVLFGARLQHIAERWSKSSLVDLKYMFFETVRRTSDAGGDVEETSANTYHRRIGHDDLFEALGPEENRSQTLVYICGVPTMTDEYVDVLGKAPGMEPKRVLCEKWW